MCGVAAKRHWPIFSLQNSRLVSRFAHEWMTVLAVETRQCVWEVRCDLSRLWGNKMSRKVTGSDVDADLGDNEGDVEACERGTGWRDFE